MVTMTTGRPSMNNNKTALNLLTCMLPCYMLLCNVIMFKLTSTAGPSLDDRSNTWLFNDSQAVTSLALKIWDCSRVDKHIFLQSVAPYRGVIRLSPSINLIFSCSHNILSNLRLLHSWSYVLISVLTLTKLKASKWKSKHIASEHFQLRGCSTICIPLKCKGSLYDCESLVTEGGSSRP